MGKELGLGSFSKVIYATKNVKTETDTITKEYAIKAIEKDFLLKNTYGMQDLINELLIMRRCH